MQKEQEIRFVVSEVFKNYFPQGDLWPALQGELIKQLLYYVNDKLTASQPTVPTLDEIVGAASFHGYTVEGGHHVPFVYGAEWAISKMQETI